MTPSKRAVVVVAAASRADGGQLLPLLRELRLAGHAVRVHSTRRGPLLPTAGVRAEATGLISELPENAALVVVAGGPGASEELTTHRDLWMALRRARTQGTWLAGVGEGVVVLARAGLLVGFRVAVDPELAGELQDLGADVETGPVIIDRGFATARGDAARELARELIVQLGHGAPAHPPH